MKYEQNIFIGSITPTLIITTSLNGNPFNPHEGEIIKYSFKEGLIVKSNKHQPPPLVDKSEIRKDLLKKIEKFLDVAWLNKKI